MHAVYEQISSQLNHQSHCDVNHLSCTHMRCLHVQSTHLLMRELCLCIPNSEVRDRRNADLKKIIPNAIERGYTDLVIVNEDHKEPSIPKYVKKYTMGALSTESVACIVCLCMLFYPTQICALCCHALSPCHVHAWWWLHKCSLLSALEETAVD